MLANKPAKSYVCIDLKSFYASVECVDRGLDPSLKTLWWPTPTASLAPSALPYARHEALA